MLPLVIISVGGLAAAAWHKARKTKQSSTYGVLTPDRKYILTRALDAKWKPEQYTKLADGFDKYGLPEAAGILRKRASLGNMTPAEKKALNDLFQKALASNKPDGIQAVSDYMASLGATGSAAKLANHAKATASAAAIPATPPETVPVGVPVTTGGSPLGATPGDAEAHPVTHPASVVTTDASQGDSLRSNPDAAASQSGAVPAGQPIQP